MRRRKARNRRGCLNVKKASIITVLAVTIVLISSCVSTVKTSDGELGSNVVDAARFVLNNRSFRKALILEQAKPVSYPDQLREEFGLSSFELAAVCTFALRVNSDENDKFAKKHRILGFSTNPSQDFWEALQGGDAEAQLADKIEQALGTHLEKTQ